MTFLGLPISGERTKLNSSLDSSVNFILPIRGENEALEARFVRRVEDYIVVYISPQTACSQGCRFCHLTASGQVKGRDAELGEIFGQAATVLGHYQKMVDGGSEKKAKVVHYNFMARGEALASEVVLHGGAKIMEGLHSMSKEMGLTPIVKFSTIGPTVEKSILEIFPYEQPDIYYSIYSMDKNFRKRWLPRAGDPMDFLGKLKAWQDVTSKIPTLHHAVIEGENSDLSSAEKIIEAVNRVNLAVNVNLVRYNPPSERHGVEPAEEVLNSHVDLYRSAWPNMRAKVVSKVGADVAASCGMFVGGRSPR